MEYWLQYFWLYVLDKDFFDPISYKSFESIQAIQGASRTLSAISIGNVYLIINVPQGHYHDIILT